VPLEFQLLTVSPLRSQVTELAAFSFKSCLQVWLLLWQQLPLVSQQLDVSQPQPSYTLLFQTD